jgi:NAD(P)-dependent dehydrogenase (short-subunit alcohol dehydrogenase family)
MQIDFNGRVAIVTGAGGGLGREHALALAARGAKVVVNDFGRTASGIETMTAAEAVVNEILKAGGQAIVSHASVTDEVAIKDTVAEAMSKWGRIDILINNAGILRDQSFAKMNLDDFRLVMDVHLMGAVICTKAVWDIMRAQNYGRIVMTTSSSGLFGNYGQSNYGAAKLALVGLMQTLSIEGAKHDIRVNCLAPTAATQMTQDLWPDKVLKAFRPEFVTPAVVVLAAEDAPNRTILCAGAGTFEAAHITMTGGAWVGNGAETAEHLRERLAEVTDRTGSVVPMSAEAQGVNEGTKALAAIGDINE